MIGVPVVSDRERRIDSDLNSTYLSAQALGDIERLGIKSKEGASLTVCDYDADGDGDPAWLVAEDVAHFDAERRAWQVWFTMDDVHWEPRQA
jgi:hypothetical protein